MTAALVSIAENHMTADVRSTRHGSVTETKFGALATALLIHLLIFVAIFRIQPQVELLSPLKSGGSLRVTLVSRLKRPVVAPVQPPPQKMVKPAPHRPLLATKHPAPRRVYVPTTSKPVEQTASVAEPVRAQAAQPQTPAATSPPPTIDLPTPGDAGKSAHLACDIPKPPYPARARRLGHEGTVELLVSIDSGGRITQVIVEKSSGFDELDEAAQQAMLAGRCDPSIHGGAAEGTTAIQPLSFNLAK
ncbi:energy transducer TonB [Paraburkholderia tropica]|uniref:energy transducer TonB n=1 Tax=Paraburkholderia tropica TaxID=92647 RepID=UPI002AB7C724|nr:TonB family protein [Paraburkholderia tropica]